MPGSPDSSAPDMNRLKVAHSMKDYHDTELISHASKVMLKILQPRLQQYVNQELPDGQAAFRKGRGIKLSTSIGL